MINFNTAAVRRSTLPEIKNIIWDVDGTLYPYHPEDKAYDFFKVADYSSASFVVDFCKKYGVSKIFFNPKFLSDELRHLHHQEVDISFALAEKISRSSYDLFQDNTLLFYLLTERKFDRKELFHGYHEALWNNCMSEHPNMFQPNKDLQRAFEIAAASGVEHFVLSHACSQEWIPHVLGCLGIAGAFKEGSVHGYQDYGYRGKQRSRAPYIYLASQNNVDLRECLFVEDSVDNLVFAKKLGMQTALVTYGQEKTLEPDQKMAIDHIFDTPTQLLQHFWPENVIDMSPKPQELAAG